MNNLESVKKRIEQRIDEIKPDLISLSQYIHQNPEIGFTEHKAVKRQIPLLTEAGFAVSGNVAGMETAFIGSKGNSQPAVAFLSEYDALIGLGHGCGHNLIAAVGCGAAIGLASVLDTIGGSVRIYGCPAEEGGVDNAGGKARLADAGAFNDVDVALMAHPANENGVGCMTSAREALSITFYGKKAHAAGPPGDGINALDALIQFFNLINGLRSELEQGCRIHGIITDGGVAPNIIPDLARARVYVRAATVRRLEQIVTRVEDIVAGIATATGAKGDCKTFAHRYYDMRTNTVLASALAANMERIGFSVVDRELSRAGGSTDMGNVSYVVPCIHPYFSIKCNAPAHTEDFRDACISRDAVNSAILMAKALACTAAEVIINEQLIDNIRNEFNTTNRCVDVIRYDHR